MRRFIALAALLLVGLLGVAAAAPSADLGLPVPAITKATSAEAAYGRGDGGSEGGGGPGVLSRLGTVLQSELAKVFYLGVACVLGAHLVQRNAGAAVAALVGAFVIGAFLLVPDQVEAAFRAVYNIVL